MDGKYVRPAVGAPRRRPGGALASRYHSLVSTLPAGRPRTASEYRAAWRELGRGSRREIVRLARAGRRHPDERTALIAYGWALSVKPAGWEVDDSAAKRLVQIVLTLNPLGADDPPSIRSWRAAKAILKVGYPLPPGVKLF